MMLAAAEEDVVDFRLSQVFESFGKTSSESISKLLVDFMILFSAEMNGVVLESFTFEEKRAPEVEEVVFVPGGEDVMA